MPLAISQPKSQKTPLARLVTSESLPLDTACYFFEQFGLAGLHSGIGPSSALSIGVAIATYVQAKPTIRINILTARFMVFLLTVRGPWEREPHGGGIIQGRSEECSACATRNLNFSLMFWNLTGSRKRGS